MKFTKLDKNAKKRLTIRGILSLIIIFSAVRHFFMGQFEVVFVCALSLFLFTIPVFLEDKLAIDIPPVLEGFIYCFIFAAEILGEINAFYTRIPGWDTMLHTLNGFLVAAVGFALVDLFNRTERFSLKLSPIFLAVVAFCFSMTIGVLWEFFEFGMDFFFATDMQKDYVMTQLNSVMFDPTQMNIVVHKPIESLIVNGEDWMALYGGYIDVGIWDTMKDLFVNFIGAIVFSVIGYFYVKSRGQGKFASSFIPTVRKPEDSKIEE